MPRLRRPDGKEVQDLLLALADRMERVATNFEQTPRPLNFHFRKVHANYLRAEAENIRAIVRREPRLF